LFVLAVVVFQLLTLNHRINKEGLIIFHRYWF